MDEGRPLNVLHVEDSKPFIRLMEAAMEDLDVPYDLETVGDGAKALERIREAKGEAGGPDIVLLDLGLPGLSGHEVLKRMDDDPELRQLTVIVVSTSDAREDIEKAYANGANAYITKPVGLDNLRDIILAIEGFWMRSAQLPPKA